MVVRPAGLASLVALAACPTFDGHRCAGAPDSCGAGGQCEPDGLCSFADSACPSGRAYGGEVAGDVAGQCTPNPCGDRQLLWRDDFDEPGDVPRFHADPPTVGAISEGDGLLSITVGVSNGDGGEYHTASMLDLRGGAIVAEVRTLPPGTKFFSYISLSIAGHSVDLWHTMTSSPRLVANVDGADVAQRPWDGTERFWRLSERAGTLSWESSADGLIWQVVHSRAAPFDLSQVRATLKAWSEGDGGTVSYESFTVCGP